LFDAAGVRKFETLQVVRATIIDAGTDAEAEFGAAVQCFA
jgi:hypothetical protein